MDDLSALERVGADRITGSLVSFLRMASRFARALAVESRVEDLAAAVYNALAYVPSIPNNATGGFDSAADAYVLSAG